MKAPASRSSIFQLLKQHFTGPKRVELPVSAYGKLPIYKDFLRHGLAGPEAQAFKRWLDRGVSRLWAGHEAYRDEEIPTQALLLSFPATGKNILGYLWGSHDHGGLRRFPFALFVSLPTPSASSHLPLIFALDQVVEQASALRRELERVPSLDAYYPLIRTSRFHLEIHGEKALKERILERQEPTVGDLADVFYGEDDEADRWPALLRHLRRSGEGSAPPFAGRLPGTGALPTAELASLWSLLLGEPRRQAKRPLQLIYSPGASYAGVTLLCRDLQLEDVYAFHPEMPEYEAITDLRQRVPGARRPPELSDPPEATDESPTPPEADSVSSEEDTTGAPEAGDGGAAGAAEPPDEAGTEETRTEADEGGEPEAAPETDEGSKDPDGAGEEDTEPENSQAEEKQAGEESQADAAEADEPSTDDPAEPTEGSEKLESDGEEADEAEEAANPSPPEAVPIDKAGTESSEASSAKEPERRPVPGELTREQRAAPFHAVLDESFLRP